jgi:Fe2+ transport system protein FeoA
MNHSVSNLNEIGKGIQVKIASFEGGSEYSSRLNRYGLYPGDIARVVRQAPFDGPVLVEVRGMEIALSKNIAAHIMVEMME